MAEKREQERVFAPGSSIGSQLSKLAERRTDIFGSGAEETQIGKKVSEGRGLERIFCYKKSLLYFELTP